MIGPRRRFDRRLLPTPAEYYAGIGLTLHGRGPWRTAVCPFHDDRRPSLRVHLASGAWRCMGCARHGGDIIDFERARTGASFAGAARALGAWR